MRRADIARCPSLPTAQTMTSPCLTKGEGSAYCGARRVLRHGAESPPRPEGLSRYGVTNRKLGHCLVFASADFPRHYPSYGDVMTTFPGVGSTVISRYVAGISADPPQMLRCQTLPSMWTLGKDEPVIPGVPFIRWRWPFHMEPPDHYDLLSYLLDLSVLQSSSLYAFTLAARFPSVLRERLRASVTF